MALEYQLYISTDSSASHLLEAIHDQFNLPWSQDHMFLDPFGVQVSALACGQSRREAFVESFGFRFDVAVHFRLANELDERREGYLTMLTVVVGLLQQEAGQAVLLFNDEIILLQRFDGDLALNLDWQTWQKQGVDLVTLPYRMQSLPSPLS